MVIAAPPEDVASMLSGGTKERGGARRLLPVSPLRVQRDGLEAKQLPKIAKIGIPNRSLQSAVCIVGQPGSLPCPSSM
jgi:hypothetical protein